MWVNTPALQTNFSPQSTAFWAQVYLDMADLMNAADLLLIPSDAEPFGRAALEAIC